MLQEEIEKVLLEPIKGCVDEAVVGYCRISTGRWSAHVVGDTIENNTLQHDKTAGCCGAIGFSNLFKV
jgi:hypothetical protein